MTVLSPLVGLMPRMRITTHELQGFGAENESLTGTPMAHLTDHAFQDTRSTLSEPLIPALSEIFTPRISFDRRNS